MILIDGIYINNSGGMILLDYLIEILESSSLDVCYLLDERIKGNHFKIINNKTIYLNPSLLGRHKFYKENRNNFSKVLCFGNLPPSLQLNSVVYTYFHQDLFLKIPRHIPLLQKMIFYLKSLVFRKLQSNTNFWIVQTQRMKENFLKSMSSVAKDSVFVIPFYPPLRSMIADKQENFFVYVSSGSQHKNHHNLLEGFKIFFDETKKGSLHLTVGDEYTELVNFIAKMKNDGYPVFNHGFLTRDSLAKIYSKATFTIYPSLSESLGLGIIEAIENHCNVIGADLPYTYAVCKPSLVFDPLSTLSIANIFKTAFEKDIKTTEQIVFNEVDKLVELLK
jgi:glycosyltransferase involved in cell wall biosynthesis